MSNEYIDIRDFINEEFENAILEDDKEESFRLLKLGFSIDISEILSRVLEEISEQLNVIIPEDLFDIPDPCVPFTLDSILLFRTRLKLRDNADISTNTISSKLKLLRETVTNKLHNGDFNDIIGKRHTTTSSKSGRTYPVIAVSDMYVNESYMYIDWYIIFDEEGIASFEFSMKNK